jgi:hypothetical protein
MVISRMIFIIPDLRNHVITYHISNRAFHNDRSGNFSYSCQSLGVNDGHALALGDVDNDDRGDIACNCETEKKPLQ